MIFFIFHFFLFLKFNQKTGEKKKYLPSVRIKNESLAQKCAIISL